MISGDWQLLAARKLRRQAEEVGKDSGFALMECAKALGDTGDAAQAEGVAEKLDRRARNSETDANVVGSAGRTPNRRFDSSGVSAKESPRPARLPTLLEVCSDGAQALGCQAGMHRASSECRFRWCAAALSWRTRR